MKLKQWLTLHNKNQSWLADQLGVTKGRVSQALKAARTGDELPRRWAVAIIHITEGQVRLEDEWPHRHRRKIPHDKAA